MTGRLVHSRGAALGAGVLAGESASEQLAIDHKAGMHRLIGVEEALPRHPRHLGIERGRARASVEGVVAVPQGKPLFIVPSRDGTDDEIAGHVASGTSRSASNAKAEHLDGAAAGFGP